MLLSSRLCRSSPAFQYLWAAKDVPDDFVSIDISLIVVKLANFITCQYLLVFEYQKIISDKNSVRS